MATHVNVIMTTQESEQAVSIAVKALDTITLCDVNMVRAFAAGRPPDAMRLVMEAICIILKVDIKRIRDVRHRDFTRIMREIKEFDIDNISPNIMKTIREKYIQDPLFQPDVVQKHCNFCYVVCNWIRALDVYDKQRRILVQ